MSADAVPPTETAESSPWAGRAALAFVLLTLVTLVAVPLLVQRRVDRLRTEIEVSEPARTLLNQQQYHLVREMAALSELLITGEAASTGAYAAARAAADTIHQELQPLVNELGGDVLSRYARARGLVVQWHERIASPEMFESVGEGARLMEVPRERQLFNDVLRATDEVDAAILRRTASIRSEIAAAEMMGLRITLLLGFMALIAAGVVAALEERGRRFAVAAHRRQRIAELALAESARANEARERLIRGVTHDVKNPLGAAKGYAELLAMGVKGPLPPEQMPLVDGVRRSVDGALHMITDLLDVARADSGGLSMTTVEVDLVEIVTAAAEDYRGSVEAAGHVLRLDVAAGELRTCTDPARIRQVLHNLLSNAVKYTPPPGTITVQAERVGGGDGGADWAVIRVIDDGPGIPPDRREYIFDEFSRIDERDGVEGHGLGLAIARKIASMLGGRLAVEDNDAPGSTFALWLPLRGEATPVERSEPPQP